MIAGRYLRKNIPYKGLVHIFRRIQGLSALFLFAVLCAFERFSKVSCPLFEIRPLLTDKGKILTSLNQLNASGVSQ
jgi:hypothetical protein